MEQSKAGAALRSLKSTLGRAAGRALGSVPELGAARLESEARKLGSAAIPQVFSRDLRRLDPSFNDELLELAGQAESVLRNRFTFLNHAQAFGREIDWESPASRTWRSELHSFDFLLPLCIMFRVSGEERYARHLRYLVADWIAANPPLEGSGWEIAPLARRFRNWVLASDLGRGAWQADAEFAQVASRSLALQSVCLERRARESTENLETPEAAVALLLSSKIFKSPRAVAQRALAITTLRAMLERAFAGGRSREANPAARVRLARAVLEFLIFEPDFDSQSSEWLRQSLDRALRSVEETLLPDGTAPLFGTDAPPGPETLNDLFSAGAAVLGAGWAKAVGDGFGVFPMLLLGPGGRERYAQLPAAEWSPAHTVESPAGLFRLAGRAKSGAVITAATAKSGHQDFLSYELMLRGVRVIVDSGAWARAEENGDDFFAGPAAHNVLLIDGAPTSPFAAGHAQLVKSADFARLRFTPPSGADGLRRERIIFGLADGGWIVLDRVSSPQPHRLQSLIHFFPTFEIFIHNGYAVAKSLSTAVSMIPFGTTETRMSAGRGADKNLPGWYSPDYGIRYEASVLALEWNQSGEPPSGQSGGSDSINVWSGGYLILPGLDAEFSPPKITLRGDELFLEGPGGRLRLPLG